MHLHFTKKELREIERERGESEKREEKEETYLK
jgi:hypothetical protein